MTPTVLDALYGDPAAQRGGIGTALLEVATSLRPDGFGLWVFESNHPARSFYRQHGLVALERTDGADNEERSPDIRMAWLGEQTLVFLRNQIGRASCRERVCQYVSISGVAGSLK